MFALADELSVDSLVVAETSIVRSVPSAPMTETNSIAPAPYRRLYRSSILLSSRRPFSVRTFVHCSSVMTCVPSGRYTVSLMPSAMTQSASG